MRALGVKRDETEWKFSASLHCAECDIHYSDATPEPVFLQLTARRMTSRSRLLDGDRSTLACHPRRIEDLAQGAVKPWRPRAGMPGKSDMVKMAAKNGVALDVPFRDPPRGTPQLCLEAIRPGTIGIAPGRKWWGAPFSSG